MKIKYTEAELSEIIQMALSDHVSFADITGQYGLLEKDVVKIMRANLKKGPTKHGAKGFTSLVLGGNFTNNFFHFYT